jgi:microcystin-dependent protein
MEPILGQLMLVGFNFAPRGWAFCEGQLLSIAQHTALFALLGTTYGGDGRTTFALPDLRGRVPIGVGSGPGLSSRNWGQKAGTENVTLTEQQIPSHSHTLNASSVAGNQMSPTGNVLGNTGNFDNEYYAGGPNTAMHTDSIGATGGGQSHNNMQPFLAMHYCIALQGIFPSRS